MHELAIVVLVVTLSALCLFVGMQYIKMPIVIQEFVEIVIFLTVFFVIIWCFIFGINFAGTI